MSQFQMDLSFNYKGVKARSKSIQEVTKHAEQYGMTYAEEFAGDIFNALYQGRPELIASDNSQYSQAIRAALESPQFQHIRNQTRNSVHWSSVGASLITSTLAKELQWNKEEQPPEPKPEGCLPQPKDGNEEEGEKIGQSKPQDKGEESSDNGEPSDDFDENEPNNSGDSDDDPELEDESDNGNGEKENDKPESDNGSEESDKEDSDGQGNGKSESPEDSDSGESDNDNEGEEETPGEDSDNESDDSSGDDPDNQGEPLEPISKDIRDAINKAAKGLDELMGGIRAGVSESMYGSKEESALSELYTALGNNPQLARIIQMVGRMQISQHFLNGISYSENQTPMSITAGRNIPNVLPQDMALLLGNREEFTVFATKYNNSELLQREYQSETLAGKGPMIVCVDESGSMYEAKALWAQSICTAMYMQALKDKRQFAVVKFATQARSMPLPKGTRIDPDFMKQMVETGYLGGGTNFAAAWDDAITIVRGNPSWKQADIVFLTDGMGRFDPNQWEKDKLQYGVRLFTFFIDPDGVMKQMMSMNNELTTRLVGLSDAMTLIEDLTEKGEKQAFAIIRNKDAKGFFEIGKNAVSVGTEVTF